MVPLTTGGDTALPRLPVPSRKAVGLTVDDGATVAIVAPFRRPAVSGVVFHGGDNGDPAVAFSGRTVTWASDADPLGSGAPGTQVLVSSPAGIVQVAVDPTGTSADPAIDLFGTAVAFDSTGDLAATGNAGARQVFVRILRGGPIAQVSRGVGTSGHAAIGAKGRVVVFDSTSDATSGADTGVAQIWVADRVAGTTRALTAGAAPSTRPTLSDDARVIAFESRADLAGDGHDTGTSQVYVHDLRTATFARLTDDAGGCTAPAVARIQRDWRVTYRCGGQVYFTMLRAGTRWRIDIPAGDTSGILPQVDVHFLLVSTTADLASGAGTTPGHQVYMVNLWKRPPVPVAGSVLWFPTQGIPPL